jgi:MYXO-CTERM domain-containing protein
VINTIIVGNDGVGLAADDADHSGTLAYDLAWSNGQDWGGELQELTGSDGNLCEDPRYHAWAVDGDPSGEILLLGAGSPARDAGDPELLDLDGTVSDMGSYGGPEATDGDVDGDGWARSEGDCDDAEGTVNPGQSEQVYDGLDNDCDPATLDDDLDGDGFGLEQDCDDEDPTINPDAEDVYGDGIDQDCDGADGDNPDTGGPDDSGEPSDSGEGWDFDGDGYSLPADCDDQDPEVNPGAVEICDDGVDNECDGFVDGSDGDCLSDGPMDCIASCSSGGRGSSLLWLLGLVGLLWRRRSR